MGTPTPRRKFLVLTGGVVAGTVLASCGAAPTPTPVPPKPAPATPTTAPPKPAPAAATTVPATPAPAKPAAATAVPAAAKPPAAKDVVTIRYMHDDTGPRAKVVEEAVLPPFAAANPQIKIQNEPTSFGEILTKVQTQYAAGVLADVHRTNTRWQRTLAEDGPALVIDDLLKGSTVAWNDVMPYHRQIWSNSKGQSCGIPDEATTRCIYIVEDLFEKTGIKVPSDGEWTKDKVLELAKALTIREGNKTVQWGYWNMPTTGSDGQFEAWLFPNGGDTLSEDFSTSVVNSPENVEVLQYWADMRHKHKVIPLPADIAGLTAVEQSPLWNGKVAMWSGHPVDKISIQQYMKKFRTRVVPWPTWKKRSNAFSGGGIALGGNTKHREEAFALLAYLVSPSTLKVMMDAGIRSFPPYPKVAQEYTSKIDPPPVNYKAFVDEFQFASVTKRALVPGKWTPLAEPLNQLLPKIYNNNEPVKAVLDEIKAALDKALKTPR